MVMLLVNLILEQAKEAEMWKAELLLTGRKEHEANNNYQWKYNTLSTLQHWNGGIKLSLKFLHSHLIHIVRTLDLVCKS